MHFFRTAVKNNCHECTNEKIKVIPYSLLNLPTEIAFAVSDNRTYGL